jgi:hypothetical protein
MSDITVDVVAQHLASLSDVEEVNMFLRQARMLAAATEDTQAINPPALKSGEEWADLTAGRLQVTGDILRDFGYMDNVMRLLDDDDNAQACRTRAVGKVMVDLGVARDIATTLVRNVALGDGGSEVLDLRGDVDAAEFLIEDRLYVGKFHLLFGAAGTNKTTLMLHDAGTLAQQGKHSILFEYEMDESAVKLMLDDLGFDREQVAQYIHIVCPSESFSAAMLLRYLGRWPDAQLIVLDNVSEAIALGDGDTSENSAGDVLRTLSVLRNIAHDRDIATVAIDHLPHHRSDAARGSTAKAQIADVAFSIEASPPVRRDQAGKLKLTCRKDRPSLIGKGRTIWLRIGDGEGGLPIVPIEVEESKWDETAVALISALQTWNDDNPGEEIGTTALIKLAGFPTSGRKFTQASAALVALSRDLDAPVAMRVVKRGSQEHTKYLYSEVGGALGFGEPTMESQAADIARALDRTAS